MNDNRISTELDLCVQGTRTGRISATQQHEANSPKADPAEDLARWLQSQGVSEADLDEYVQEAAQQLNLSALNRWVGAKDQEDAIVVAEQVASNINNDGMTSQLLFLRMTTPWEAFGPELCKQLNVTVPSALV
jgi:hypothetical protein